MYNPCPRTLLLPISPTAHIACVPTEQTLRIAGPHYARLDSKRRGKAICINRVALRQDLLDRAILGAIGEALDPAVVTAAMEKALARMTKRQRTHLERRAQVERELAQVQQRLDRLVDALADGSVPADEIKNRLSTEKARKTALTAEFARLERLAKV